MIYLFIFSLQIILNILIYIILKKRVLRQIEIEKIEKIVDTLIISFKKKADEKLAEMQDNILYFEELSKKNFDEIKKKSKSSSVKKSKSIFFEKKKLDNKNLENAKTTSKKLNKKIDYLLSDEVDLETIVSYNQIKFVGKKKIEDLLEKKMTHNFNKLTLEQKILYLYKNNVSIKEIASKLKVTISEVNLYLKKKVVKKNI